MFDIINTSNGKGLYMKVGVVYTGTTPELIADVEREVKSQLGNDAEFYNQADPTIIQDANKVGYVTTAPAARLIGMFAKAAEEGCDVILNCCSSVGEVADAAQDLGKYWGVPIVRIDELMCREAVKLGSRIGVMATLPTTLNPTKNTVLRVSREMNKHVEIVDILVEGAFGLDQTQFKQRLSDAAAEIIDKVDVVVLAQGSMAYAAADLTEKYGKPFLGSPHYGAVALKKALIEKGTIAE